MTNNTIMIITKMNIIMMIMQWNKNMKRKFNKTMKLKYNQIISKQNNSSGKINSHKP